MGWSPEARAAREALATVVLEHGPPPPTRVWSEHELRALDWRTTDIWCPTCGKRGHYDADPEGPDSGRDMYCEKNCVWSQRMKVLDGVPSGTDPNDS